MRDYKSGTTLANRYTLVRKLGSGGDCAVWLASDRMTAADVALKLIVSDKVSAAALRREWQLSIRLMHAHIVRVFEFHDLAAGNDAAFFSLQYIDGPDLSVLAGVELEDALAPVGFIADALAYAHAKGVAHCDIKAANVLLDANGAPYLIDFGVAARAEDQGGGGSLIAMSPARLAGKPAEPADDIFALGGLIYELVSGASPWRSEHTADDIRERAPLPLTRPDGSEVSAGLQALVSAMLDKDPAQRPDAGAVTDGLLAAGVVARAVPKRYLGTPRALGSQTIETGEVSRRYAAPTAAAPVAARHGLSPRTVGIALLLLVGLLLAVVFLLPDTLDRPEQDAGELAVDADSQVEESDPDPAPARLPERDERVQSRIETDAILGRLLSKVRTLEGRAVDRWGGIVWQKARAVYEAGDAAYLARDFEQASKLYEEADQAVTPLLDEVDRVFQATLDDANAALDAGDSAKAVELFELAVAISPDHGPAKAGLTRAQNLDEVLVLTDQGLRHERDLELDAARDAFSRAIEIDPKWQVATQALARVNETIRQMEFDSRMTEGLAALAVQDYVTARAAFRMAKELKPDSPEPADGLLQVDQGLRLGNIAALETDARALEESEQWQQAAEAYQQILELDSNLTFAKDGLRRSKEMIALHDKVEAFISDPDSLSQDRKMAEATKLVVDITRMPVLGPRLAADRDELSRLLKRAATPLTVRIVSDEMTNVSIYKVAKLGTFDSVELSLRPGTYVAVGSRPGYRDVRTEFRVAPEIEMDAVVVRCEEQI